MLRILTLNTGLLSILGGRVQFAPYVEERLAELPRQLKKLDVDILALQEVYRQPHREWIISGLRDVLPYSLYVRKKRHWGLENGLMLLSKTPVSGSLHLFQAAPMDERFLDSKGFLVANLEMGGRNLTVINLHTTAGGLRSHPESLKANRLRANQIQQVIDYARNVAGTLVVTGDLNAGLGVSEENFQQFLDADYASIHDLLHPGSDECTWDPQNQLNRASPHKKCPPQRIDHVLIHNADLQSGQLRPLSSVICCCDEVVPVLSGNKVTVSDHFGLLVEVEWESSSRVLIDRRSPSRRF